ncbi:MAG: nitroreductase family deazaflavin-dependent oxidoreductase [Acidimicrobiales bacterium]|jgi:deazaflavin-dependent oxidoreductase (nitroreductase family)|nr:nitroreductase family deazaflavin-dependent oxidoreductase [Acidimicrobiales bacterium]
MSDVDFNEWNTQIIAEFRANAGKVGGPFEGAPMVLVTHRGAKTGIERTTPLMYLPEGDAMVVFASKAGAPTNPDWYHNLLANPEATAEVGTETLTVRARVAEGAERDELWERQKQAYPQFQGYEDATDRVIPVVVLERA